MQNTNGITVVLPWFHRGDTIVMWFYHGITMAKPDYQLGFTMVIRYTKPSTKNCCYQVITEEKTKKN